MTEKFRAIFTKIHIYSCKIREGYQMSLNQDWFNEMIDKDNQILETYRELLLLIGNFQEE